MIQIGRQSIPLSASGWRSFVHLCITCLLLQLLVLEGEPEGLDVVLPHPLVAGDLDLNVVEVLVDVVGVGRRHDAASVHCSLKIGLSQHLMQDVLTE